MKRLLTIVLLFISVSVFGQLQPAPSGTLTPLSTNQAYVRLSDSTYYFYNGTNYLWNYFLNKQQADKLYQPLGSPVATPFSLSAGYGLSGSSFNGSVARTFTADTTSADGLVSKSRLATNLGGYVPSSRTITINGATRDLSANRTWNVGTVLSVGATAGTGISIAGTSPITSSGTYTITNTAPDQTVALTDGTGIDVTGTYPNFTITNTAPSSGGTVTSVTPAYGLTPQTAITTTGSFGIDTLVLDTVYAKPSDIPTQYWTTGTGTSIIPNGSFGTRITSPIGSGTGVFRSDVQTELYGTNAGLSLFNNRAIGAINSDESFIVTGANDAGGTAGKTSSISAKWYDVTAGAAKGLLRLNTTTSSGAVDNIQMRLFGNDGIAVFGTDDATYPGSGIFKVHGQIVATGTVTMPTPFTLGATSVTTTGTQLNYLNAATGTTGTASTNLVFSTSPTLTTPNIGAATFSTLTGGTASTITFANTSAGSITDAISIRNGGTTTGTGNRINFITGTSLQSARINSVLTSATAGDLVFSTMTGSTLGEAGRFLGDKTLQLSGSLQTTAINGSTAANGDIAIQGTTDATRTTSYVNLQPNGGLVGIGTSTPSSKLHVEGASSTSFFGGDQLRVASTASGDRAEIHLTDGITSDAAISFLPSATAATRNVEITANGADGGIKVYGNGQVKIDTAPTTSAGSYDALTRNTSTGAIEKLAMSSGTYTPTLTNDANVGSSTAYVTGYYRVGNMVTIAGAVDITATSSGITTIMFMSLPIASNFAAKSNGGGSGSAVSNMPVSLIPDAATDTIKFSFVPNSAGSNWNFNFEFSYQVL